MQNPASIALLNELAANDIFGRTMAVDRSNSASIFSGVTQRSKAFEIISRAVQRSAHGAL
jgi:hypothetical protein